MTRPTLPNGYLGPQPKFKEFKLSTLSHNNPEITVDSNELEIKLAISQPMKVTCNLLQVETNNEFRDLVFTQTLGDVVSLLIRLPAAGYYKLQVYALSAADTSKTLPGVYNYLLHCTATPQGPVHAFPKQYAQWKEGCFLEAPLSLHGLADMSKVRFRARIPGVQAAAVTVAGSWTKLEPQDDSFWEGVADLSQHKGSGNKVCLNANFGGDSTKYSTLLEYDMP